MRHTTFAAVITTATVTFIIPIFVIIIALARVTAPADPVLAQEYDATKKPPVAVNRTTQVFVNLNDSNWRLDKNLFVPFGVVVGEQGMKTFDNIYSGYGQDPDQVRCINVARADAGE